MPEREQELSAARGSGAAPERREGTMTKLVVFMLFCVGACQRSAAPGAGKSETAEPGSAAPTSSPSEAPNGPNAATTFSFDADRVGGPPKGFVFGRTGGGPPGRWVVQVD